MAMKKWPQKWLGVLCDARRNGAFDGDILSALDAVGALKEVPQPSEIWMCRACGWFKNYPYTVHSVGALGPCGCTDIIHYREVEES